MRCLSSALASRLGGMPGSSGCTTTSSSSSCGICRSAWTRLSLGRGLDSCVTRRMSLPAGERRDIRRVTQLAFAGDLAPAAMSGYLAKDPKGLVRVARLPATDDPIATRVERIRQRDATVIDTVNGYYANFSDQMSLSHGQCRPASCEEH